MTQKKELKNILITGAPGIGKTTLITSLAQRLSSLRLSGFFTREIRVSNKRVGFEIGNFCGNKAILAHISIKSKFRVGKYFVNVKNFERIAIPELKKALENSQIILIDEVGKMELFSEQFKKLLMQILDASIPCAATIMAKSHPFADLIKSRKDCQLFELTIINRNSIVDEIFEKSVGFV